MTVAISSISPKIYFVRHGETDWNVAGRMQGQRDIPLNEKGRWQAEEAGLKLAKLIARPAELDYLSSPMLRTVETADIFMRTLGLEPKTCRREPLLKEIAFGQWEGMTWKEVRQAHPEMYARRDMDRWGTVSPEGESYAMLAERVRPVLATLTRDTVLISHGGVARAVLAATGCVAKEKAPLIDIWQGRILVIEGTSFNWV